MAGRPQRGLSVVSIQDDIRKATDCKLKEPDWGQNMQIVDKLSNILVVVPAYGDKVSKELLLRITHKEHQVAILALGLLETIVKNIPAFHPFVADAKFLKAMVKTLPRRIRKPREKQNVFKSATENKPSTKESIERYDRVLILLQDWATAFKGQSKFESFEDTYQQLRQRGCIFPEPLKDEISPIFTPEATQKSKPKSKEYEIKVSGPSKNKEYTDGECRVANQSVIVFVEMLSESDEKDDLSKNDLIQELLKTIQTYQKKTQTRVMSGISSEVIMAEVLEVNDKMSQALAFYNGLLDGSIKREKKKPTEIEDPESVELSDSANEEEKDQVVEDPFASIANSSSKLSDSPKLIPLPKPHGSGSGHSRRKKKKSKDSPKKKNKKFEQKNDQFNLDSSINDKKPKTKTNQEINIFGDDIFGGNTAPVVDPFAVNTDDNPFSGAPGSSDPFGSTTVDPFDMLANNSGNVVDPFGSDMFSTGPPPASQPPPNQVEGVPNNQPGGMDDFFDMFTDMSASQPKGTKTDQIDFDDEFLALAKRN